MRPPIIAGVLDPDRPIPIQRPLQFPPPIAVDFAPIPTKRQVIGHRAKIQYNGDYKENWISLLKRRKKRKIQTIVKIIGRGDFSLSPCSTVSPTGIPITFLPLCVSLVHLVNVTIEFPDDLPCGKISEDQLGLYKIYMQDIEHGYWVENLSHHRTLKFQDPGTNTYDEYVDEETNLTLRNVLNLPK